MKKLALALAACVLTAAAAKADSITLTGPGGTLPVGTTATLDYSASVTTTGGFFDIFLSVVSGPDAGQSLTSGFACAPSLIPTACPFSGSVVLINDGMSGTDVIDATLSGAPSPLTTSTSVTWGSPTTGTPEPGTLSLLVAALAGSLALRRSIAR